MKFLNVLTLALVIVGGLNWAWWAWLISTLLPPYSERGRSSPASSMSSWRCRQHGR